MTGLEAYILAKKMVAQAETAHISKITWDDENGQLVFLLNSGMVHRVNLPDETTEEEVRIIISDYILHDARFKQAVVPIVQDTIEETFIAVNDEEIADLFN